MTDDQVNVVVQHLCEQLHLALRLKDSEAHPPNAKVIGFDSISVRTALLTGLRSAGVTIHREAAGRAKSRSGPKGRTRGRSPAPMSQLIQSRRFGPESTMSRPASTADLRESVAIFAFGPRADVTSKALPQIEKNISHQPD